MLQNKHTPRPAHPRCPEAGSPRRGKTFVHARHRGMGEGVDMPSQSVARQKAGESEPGEETPHGSLERFRHGPLRGRRPGIRVRNIVFRREPAARQEAGEPVSKQSEAETQTSIGCSAVVQIGREECMAWWCWGGVPLPPP